MLINCNVRRVKMKKIVIQLVLAIAAIVIFYLVMEKIAYNL